MNDTLIVTAFVITDDLMHAMGHRSHPLARVGNAEMVTVAVTAAACFGNHHERALCVMRGMGYLSGALSVSRFNRRAHALADWLLLLLDALGVLFAHGDAFMTVCRRVRAGRCRKVRGRAYCGWCAITSGCREHWWACISSPSSFSCSNGLSSMASQFITPSSNRGSQTIS